MPKLVLLALCLCAWPLHAGQIYRCVGPGGAVSYQAKECRAGHRLSRTIHYVPQPDSAPRRVAAAATGGRRATSTRRAIGRSGAPPRAAVDRCSQAKARRQAELERLGLRRTFEDLSRIDADVRRTCNGF